MAAAPAVVTTGPPEKSPNLTISCLLLTNKTPLHLPCSSLCLFPFQWQDVLYALMSLSCVWLFATPWTAARQASLSFNISLSFLKLMSVESVMPSNCLILCHPLLLLPSIFPNIRVFFNESALCIRWPKYWSFSISSSNEYSGLISFRIDLFDLPAVQRTFKSPISSWRRDGENVETVSDFNFLGSNVNARWWLQPKN